MARKLLVIPDTLLQLVEVKAKAYGLSLQDYLRHIMAENVKNMVEPVETLTDPELLKDLKEAIDDVKHGRVISLNSKEEIDKYIDNIVKIKK